MALSKFLPALNAKETLEDFIERALAMPKEFKKQVNQTIDHIQRHLERLPEYGVERAIRGGSIAKSTAVMTMLDVDIIIFISGYCTRKKPSIKNMKDFVEDKRKNGGILCCLKDHLTSSPVYIRHFVCVRETDYHIALETKNGPKIKVDLVPAITVCNVDETMRNVYTRMNRHETDVRSHFSPCLAEMQCQFIKRQPKPVRNLIKLVKYWKKTNDLELRSYCCELLCVWVFRHSFKNGEKFPMKDGFTAVLQHLENYSDLHAYFEDHYKSDKIGPNIGRPYVMDPVNPFMNTCCENLTRQQVDKITRVSRQTKLALNG